MTRMVKLLSPTLIMLFLCGFVAAETEFDVSAQVRARNEVSNKAITGEQNAQEYTYLRTRVNLNAAKENASAFVQIQDSRMLGSKIQYGDWYSGSCGADGKNAEVHQAYFKINELWNNGLGLKAGRFEVKLGSQRAFAVGGWNNVGLAWDGVQLWYDCSKATASGYWLKKQERNSTDANEDYNAFLFTTKLKSMNLELFGFIQNDAYKPTTYGVDTTYTSYTSTYNNLSQYSLGLYYQRNYQQFDFALNSVYQLGKEPVWNSTDVTYDERDLSGLMFNVEAGYTFKGDKKARLAAAIDYTTADDAATADEIETYDNLYYSGHGYRGYMDYFKGSQPLGMMDIVLRGKISPVEGWCVKGDFHLFSYIEDYTDFEGNETNSVGNEFDFIVSTSRVAGLDLSAGACFFMPTDEYAKMKYEDKYTETNMGTWFFTQAIVNF
ncbi:MAG: alginate export family protein [candidate division Zixibacteria bacterium]|nr:alginate export family protein [candidate division Zixibacteria bacterium]